MTECVKIKCDDCKFVEDCVDYGWDGCRKFTPKPSKPLTEQEWLQTRTTEQLAEWLFETFDLCGAGCSNCFVQKLCFVDNDKMPTEMFVEWLKQPHNSPK